MSSLCLVSCVLIGGRAGFPNRLAGLFLLEEIVSGTLCSGSLCDIIHCCSLIIRSYAVHARYYFLHDVELEASIHWRVLTLGGLAGCGEAVAIEAVLQLLQTVRSHVLRPPVELPRDGELARCCTQHTNLAL
jgi:hypothetical protein